MIVVKFGGTSLAGTERMRAAARIVAAESRDQMVVCVVSAMAGVTDALIRTTEQATRGETAWVATLAEIRTRHFQTITGLTHTTGTIPEITRRFEDAWMALEADLAQLVEFSHDAPSTERTHAAAAFSAWGERLSVLLFAQALAAEGIRATPYAGEPVVMVAVAPPDDPASSGDLVEGGDATVPWERLHASVAATRAELTTPINAILRSGAVAVLPGYLARTTTGLVTTLGRNGSDYSAAVVAAALGAEGVHLYSDVAGVYRADPRAVPEADLLPALTYADAAEIATLGAKVLHPDTLRPLAAAHIPLRMRSTFAPEAPGTLIGAADAVTRRVAAHEWVIAARPLLAGDPLLGLRQPETLPADHAVEVSCLLLTHADLPAYEDDHLTSEILPPTRASASWRFSIVVPVAKSHATQRRLFQTFTHLSLGKAPVVDALGAMAGDLLGLAEVC